jgi:hypothetical protein
MSPMIDQSALQPAGLDPARDRRAQREAHLAQRERDLSAFKGELQQLQARYLTAVGGLYARLSELEAELLEAEIRAGIRPAPRGPDSSCDADPASDAAASPGPSSCSNRPATSDGLKRVFRDVAKAIHPDLAMDDPARCRRHSLMAEANRAYADRDEDRLRLILRAWERSPESVMGDDADAFRQRAQRKAAAIDERLIEIEAEFADLRTSAIFRLKNKIDEAKSQGWDLFAEMILQVKREVSVTSARLASLRRTHPAGC